MIAPNETAGGKAKQIKSIKPDFLQIEPACAVYDAELQSLVESLPHLFERPKTCVMHGTKVGFSTTIGSIVFDDADNVVQAIERKLKDRFDELVEVNQQPQSQQIRNSNSYSLAAQVIAAGAEPMRLPIARDERAHMITVGGD